VATAFALAVVFPTAGNLGGGGFAVVRSGDQSFALDFRETAPLSATRDMFLDKKTGKPTAASSEGATSAGVPGSVAGLHALYTKAGSKKVPWGDLLAPAIRLASEGVVVTQALHEQIDSSKEKFTTPGSAAIFLPGGSAPAVGSTWKNPDLAATLTRIAKDGPKSFYEGETAKLIAAEMKRDHGFVTLADL
jgi:gamma-glutamyltranspeptidase/glutathione hydrolase